MRASPLLQRPGPQQGCKLMHRCSTRKHCKNTAIPTNGEIHNKHGNISPQMAKYTDKTRQWLWFANIHSSTTCPSATVVGLSRGGGGGEGSGRKLSRATFDVPGSWRTQGWLWGSPQLAPSARSFHFCAHSPGTLWRNEPKQQKPSGRLCRRRSTSAGKWRVTWTS